MSHLRYHFYPVTTCNMCGSPTAGHKILGKRLNKSQGKNPRKRTGITTTVCQCSNCKLIYSNPQPVPFDLQDHYGVPPEDYWVPEYFIVDENYGKGQLQIVKKLLGKDKDILALDIGAGLGKGMIAMEKEGFTAYGFEPSKPFHEAAINKMKIPAERLQLGQIENVIYPENHFEYISFGAVLEHLYDPAGSIEIAMKWLKPGGIIHIEVPSSNWLVNKIGNLYYRLIMTDYVSNISPMHEPFHLYEFGLKSFEEHARKNNYSIVFHDYYVGPTYMPKFLEPLLIPLMQSTKTGMQLAVYLRK